MSSAIQSFGARSGLNILSKTANYALAITDDIIICNGTFTVTMPTAASALNKPITIINVGTGVITIARQGSDTFGSETSLELQPGISPNHPSVSLIPQGGTKWYIQ